ncbi:MAG: glycosyltransferase family 4 protein [Treponema sp.]|nr:glycosyltransferase family 4 protein [Treponema sp.]
MVLINGYFHARPLTGIERYALEITRRLDALSRPGEIAIIVPGDLSPLPSYQNLSLIPYKKKIPHILWQMFYLQGFLLRHRQYQILDFGNTCLPLFPGIIFLHDIYCEVFPQDFTSLRDRLVRLYNRSQYRLITRRARQVATVSYFTRNQIAERFSVDPSRIKVIYSSHEHFNQVQPDYSVFDSFPALSKGSYYFSLGSYSKRKNLGWIIRHARAYPDRTFALSGTSIATTGVRELDGELPPNVILLGYLNDSQVKALMTECRAFILPSYYEGFGLTPLEALSCGAPTIVARAASLPEIFGDHAHYIDPYNTDIDLEALLAEPVESPLALLAKYSYDTSARMVYDMIKET